MKKKIIIADDNEDSLYLMVTILQKHGYEVLGFKDGTVIMDGLCEWPDLFILDKEMDYYDGMAIAKHLKSKAEGKPVPVMMVSGSTTPKEAVTAAGIDLFLPKPFKAEHLLASVNNLIRA